MRDRASHADLSPPESPDISKFLTQSDFRVDFSKRRRAVFMVTGYMGVMAGFAYAVPLWGVYRAIERGVPVDPTIGNILEGINTALFINVAAIIGGYLIVPAWEASNFRKNFTDVIRTVGHTSVARTAAKYGGGPSPRDKEG
jgi:hypothetical protein